MVKTLELNEEQFKQLNILVQLGSLVSMRCVELESLDDITQYFYSYAKEFKCADLIKYSNAEERYLPTRKMEEILYPYLDSFKEDYFWQELAFLLATRDFEDENSPAAIRKMTVDEKLSAIMSYMEGYENELFENGLSNFVLVEQG